MITAKDVLQQIKRTDHHIDGELILDSWIIDRLIPAMKEEDMVYLEKPKWFLNLHESLFRQLMESRGFSVIDNHKSVWVSIRRVT
jgi:hypothetical protein